MCTIHFCIIPSSTLATLIEDYTLKVGSWVLSEFTIFFAVDNYNLLKILFWKIVKVQQLMIVNTYFFLTFDNWKSTFPLFSSLALLLLPVVLQKLQKVPGGPSRWTGVRHGDHLPPNKYIKSTFTCGTTPTEHLLNAGRRPQTSQKARNSPRTCVGQKKKEKTETKK